MTVTSGQQMSGNVGIPHPGEQWFKSTSNKCLLTEDHGVAAMFLYSPAVKKGRGALAKSFKDQPEDDFDDRAEFQIEKVEFPMFSGS